MCLPLLTHLHSAVCFIRLNLKNNSIGDKGLTALAHAFNDNSTLQSLLVWVRGVIVFFNSTPV